MGTRSRLDILDRDDNIIISIYRQFDGNFEGMGKDLTDFLTTNRLAKTISRSTNRPDFNQGMEDLAGQLFCFLKKKSKQVMPAFPQANIDYAFKYEIGFRPGTLNGFYLKGMEYSGKNPQWGYLFVSP